MTRCDHCGNHVSDEFARVFEVDGRVRACIECANLGTTARTSLRRSESR